MHAISYAKLMALLLWLPISMGGRHFQCPGPSPTLESLGPSHQRHHMSRVSLWDPLCAHGVLHPRHGNVHDICKAFLVLFQHVGIHIKRWGFLGLIHSVPKIYGCQQHLDFEFPKIEVPFIELVNDSSNIALK